MKCVISLAISLLFIVEDFLLHSVVWKITEILWGCKECTTLVDLGHPLDECAQRPVGA